MSLDQFRTNGTHASFQDFRFDFSDGSRSYGVLTGLQEFNWKESVERGEERENGSPFVSELTTGEYSAEGSLVWKREAFDAFVDKAASYGYGRFDLRGNATCIYRRKDGKLMTIVIKDVLLKSLDSQNKTGTEALKVNVDLQIAGRIYINGQGPFANDKL